MSNVRDMFEMSYSGEGLGASPKRLFFLGAVLSCLVCDLNSNISCNYYKIMLNYFRACQAYW